MNAPTLTLISDTHPVQGARLPLLHQGPTLKHFVVTRGGQCREGGWSAGEVLVCRGGARDGDRVVLVPRGRGAPRLGRIENNRILGDSGEPCHPGRWQVAGRLVGTWQQLGEGWVCTLSDAEVAHRVAPRLAPTQASTAAPVARREVQGTQLALFAA